MRFGLKEKELEVIIQSIASIGKVDKAVIFGSRARGDYSRTSDIDIAVYSNEMTSTELNLLRDQLNQIDIIYKIDLVNLYTLNKAALIENIDREGQVIYIKKEEKTSEAFYLASDVFICLINNITNERNNT